MKMPTLADLQVMDNSEVREAKGQDVKDVCCATH